MKMRMLFNLLEDVQDVTELFAKVETPEQMVSMLERVKKQGAAEFLEAVQSLRLSLEAAMNDTLEMGGPLGDNEFDDALGDDDEKEDLLEGLDEEEEPKKEEPKAS